MLVFVDESGDSGTQKKKGTSKYFVIAAVIFLDQADADSCDQAINVLRHDCFGNNYREFKFNNCCREHRHRFLSLTSQSEYLYFGFVLNKAELWGEGFKYKGSFYKYTTKLLFENLKRYLQNATVVIDGCGEREFRQQLQTYLKDKINTEENLIHKVKIQPSHSNNLLQLADMVCGAIARCYRTDKKDCEEYRDLIKTRELGVRMWPLPKLKHTRKK